MNGMFYNAYSFNQDIGRWDVSHVEDMNRMFNGASNFNQNINSWNISNVKDKLFMFDGSPLEVNLPYWYSR